MWTYYSGKWTIQIFLTIRIVLVAKISFQTNITVTTPKGQLISKCLFGVPKNEQKQVDLKYHSSFFVRFLEELRIPNPKIPFKIN